MVLAIAALSVATEICGKIARQTLPLRPMERSSLVGVHVRCSTVMSIVVEDRMEILGHV